MIICMRFAAPLSEWTFMASLMLLISKEELRAGKQAVIQASVVLVDGSSLHVREYIDAAYGIKKVSYGYHYQDRHGKLVFRYDNARHKLALQSKEHKHLSDNSIVEAAAPSISELVEEVVSFL